MTLKGLPLIKCTNCGKSTVKDEYELNGCCPNCHSTIDGQDYGTYRRRETLVELGEGFHTFTGTFKKVGNLHFKNNLFYSLISDVKCGTHDIVTNHAYVANISPNSINLLKELTPGAEIMFKARINCYNKSENKWGFDRMKHVVPLH